MRTLEELDEIFNSLHAQPRLSDDDSEPGDKWIWVYGNDVAYIKVIKEVKNEQTSSI